MGMNNLYAEAREKHPFTVGFQIIQSCPGTKLGGVLITAYTNYGRSSCCKDDHKFSFANASAMLQFGS